MQTRTQCIMQHKGTEAGKQTPAEDACANSTCRSGLMQRESQPLLTGTSLLHLQMLLDPSRALARQAVINENLSMCMYVSKSSR